MKTHALSEIFPAMDGSEYASLVADIQKHGLIQPLVMYQGKVLDGRNRARACEQLGIKPKTTDYRGNDPLGYVLSLNLARRHLTPTQRAIVAENIVTCTHGGARDRGVVGLKTAAKQDGEARIKGSHDPLIAEVSREKAAKLMDTSTGTMKRVRKVLDRGTPELKTAMKSAKMDANTAAKLADAPVATQKAAAEGGKAVAREIVKKIEAEREVAPSIPTEPPVKTFGRPIPDGVKAKVDLRLRMIDEMSRLLVKLAGQLTAYEREIAPSKPEREQRVTQFREPLETLSHRIRAQRPVSVCCWCKTVPEAMKDCGACRGLGFLRKEQMVNIPPVYLAEGDDAIVALGGREVSLLSATGEDF
jgi:hypothetical protein